MFFLRCKYRKNNQMKKKIYTYIELVERKLRFFDKKRSF